MIYKACLDDVHVVAEMANIMWTNHTLEDLEQEFKGLIASENSVVFIMSKDGQAVGFAQCQLRFDYVEGTDSSPVGYLEGIFIREEYRNRGYAKELLKNCEEWAAKKGCTEFASDCEMTNDTSLKFHLRMGFKEANRIICFSKKL